jgi:hypothetical protein
MHGARPPSEGALLFHDLLEDGRQQHQVDELRVELCATASGDHVGRGFRTTAMSIGAVVGNGIERVRERYDPGRERDLYSLKLVRIACSVPSLVMAEYTLGQIRIEGCERGKDIGASSRMREDLASFTGCETRVLVDDVEERFVNLPDIVEQRDALNDSSIVTIELRGFREDERVRGNSAHVCSGLSIVCVDCIEE